MPSSAQNSPLRGNIYPTVSRSIPYKYTSACNLTFFQRSLYSDFTYPYEETPFSTSPSRCFTSQQKNLDLAILVVGTSV